MIDSTTPTLPTAFGPVPSRRLGRSLGINNIPPKICSYSCAYCQVGRTRRMKAVRGNMYAPADVLHEVETKVRRVRSRGESIDYLTFVSDGEPTLDANLGREIRELRPLGIKTAVITNASLIDREDVQVDLAAANWVSLKVDAVDPRTWRRINRPHGSLDLGVIMQGAHEFSRRYQGRLVTETMLVRGVNDGEDHLRRVAAFINALSPDKAYLSVPTRPPAGRSVLPPSGDVVNRAYQIFCDHVDSVECLIGYEGNAFASTGDATEDLLGITAVHPMKKEAVEELLANAGADWNLVRDLIGDDALVETTYGGDTFFVRSPRSFAGRDG